MNAFPGEKFFITKMLFILFQIKKKSNISLKTFFLISCVNKKRYHDLFITKKKKKLSNYPDNSIKKEVFINEIKFSGSKNSITFKNNTFFYFEYSNFFLSKYQKEIPKNVIFNEFERRKINIFEKIFLVENNNFLYLKILNKKFLRKHSVKKTTYIYCFRKTSSLFKTMIIGKIYEKKKSSLKQSPIILSKKSKFFSSKFHIFFDFYCLFLKNRKTFLPNRSLLHKLRSNLKNNKDFIGQLKKINFCVFQRKNKNILKECNHIEKNFRQKIEKVRKNFLNNFYNKNLLSFETNGDRLSKKVHQLKILFRKRIFINFDHVNTFKLKILPNHQKIFQLIIENPEAVLNFIKKLKIFSKILLIQMNLLLKKLEEKTWLDSTKVFVKKFGEKKAFILLLKKKAISPRIFFPDILETLSNCVEILKKNLVIKNRNENDIKLENTDKKFLVIFLSHLNISEKVLRFFHIYFSEFYFLISWQSSNFFLQKEFGEDTLSLLTYLCGISRKFQKKIFKKMKNLTFLIVNNQAIFLKSLSRKFGKNLREFNKKENREKIFSSFVELLGNLKIHNFKKKFGWLTKNLVKKINTLENIFFFRINCKNLFSIPFSIGLLSLCLQEEIIIILSKIEVIRHKKVKGLVFLFVLFFGFSGKKLNKKIISLVFKNFFDLISLNTQKKKRISKFFEIQKEQNKHCSLEILEFEKIKENEMSFTHKKAKSLTCLLGLFVLFLGNNKNLKLLLEIFNNLKESPCHDIKENIHNIIGLLIFSKPTDMFVNFLFELSMNENIDVAKNAIFLLGIIGINCKNPRILYFLRFLVDFYVKQRNENFNSSIKNSKNMLGSFQKNFKSLVLFARVSQAMNFFENRRTLVLPCIFAKKFDFSFLISLMTPIFLEKKFGIEKSILNFIIYFLPGTRGTRLSRWILDKNFKIKATVVGKGKNSFVPNIFKTLV